MIDILTIDPANQDEIGELIDLLRAHCTPAECETFLTDLRRWERSIPKEARPVLDAYGRMVRRGAFVPAIVAKYVRIVQPLEASPEWAEVMQWQRFIASLPRPARQEAA